MSLLLEQHLNLLKALLTDNDEYRFLTLERLIENIKNSNPETLLDWSELYNEEKSQDTKRTSAHESLSHIHGKMMLQPAYKSFIEMMKQNRNNRELEQKKVNISNDLWDMKNRIIDYNSNKAEFMRHAKIAWYSPTIKWAESLLTYVTGNTKSFAQATYYLTGQYPHQLWKPENK